MVSWGSFFIGYFLGVLTTFALSAIATVLLLWRFDGLPNIEFRLNVPELPDDARQG